MSDKKLGIFPASGGIGGSTYRHLLDIVDPKDVILVARNPKNIPAKYIDAGVTARYADYDDASTLEHAFDGMRCLNLISYASIDHHERVKVHKLAIDAARLSGVCHIVYSSLGFARDGDPTSVAHVMQAHLDTEKYLASIAAEDPSFTYMVIREGLYSESFPLYTAFFDISKPPNEIKIPHNGSGPGIAWAKQDELGEATAHLFKQYAASPEGFAYTNKIVLLSGPRVWSLNETAEVLGKAVRKPIIVRETPIDEYSTQQSVANAGTYGSGSQAVIWATVFEAIRRGEAAVVTPHLKQLIGREPESFDETVVTMAKAV